MMPIALSVRSGPCCQGCDVGLTTRLQRRPPWRCPCPSAGVIGTAAYSAPELLNPDTPTESRTPGPRDEQRILKADVR